MKFSSMAIYALAYLIWHPAVPAQNPEGCMLRGTILDNTTAVVPGATVTVTGPGGESKTATSDEKGEYVIAGLAPGSYTVVIAIPGFKEYKKEGLVLEGSETKRFDATLEPASVQSSVTVEGQSVTRVEQESAQISGLITSKEVTAYALNGRNFTQLIALAPGVSNQTGQDEALVGIKGSVNYSVNGGRVEYNSYEVDGGDILNASINGNHSTLIVYPSIDSINELQVLTSNYGAMYGRTASGTIVTSTKSGGSDFHGNGYFFLRNNHLNARNFFDQTKSAPLYQKYDPGATLGGPLYIPGHYNEKKDKTFFFVSEEYRHEKEPITYNQGVPTMAERNCQLAASPSAACLDPTSVGIGTNPSQFPYGANTVFGDFSDVCPGVNSLTGKTNFARSQQVAKANGVPYAPDCPGILNGAIPGLFIAYPGNLVPIDPRSLAILNTGLIPAPNSQKGCNSSIGSCYDASVSPLTTWREDLIRIDHNFSQKQRIYFRYIHDAWSTVVTTPQWGVVHNSFPTVENQFDGPGTSMVAHWSSTVGVRLVNDLAMSYSTDHITITNIPGPGLTPQDLQRPALLNNSPCVDTPTNTSCGVGYFFNNGGGGKIPGLIFAGTNAAYGGAGFAVDSSYMPWHHSNPTYSPRDDATLALGKHTLQFGALFEIAQRNEVNPPVGANIGDLQGLATFSNVNNAGSSGNVFADFLHPVSGGSSLYVGDFLSFQQDSAQFVYHNNYSIIEPYVQDDWKVTRRLSLNLGLRMSLFKDYHEKNLASFNWIAPQFNSQLASQVTVNPGEGYLVSGNRPLPFNPNDLNNLDPHLTNGVLRCGVDKISGVQIPSSCLTSTFFNPAPRIGVAWDPIGDGKTSIRAGYGIFFEHGTGNEANTGSLEGSPGPAKLNGVIDMTQNYALGWECLGNAATAISTHNCGNGGTAFPLNATSIPTKTDWPYVQQWSFSVQRELPWNVLASVAYVGSRGTHLTALLQENQLVPVNPSQNIFQPGQPITSTLCQSYGPNPGGIFFLPNGSTLGPGNPLYTNLEAACTGLTSAIPVPNALRQASNSIAPSFGQVYSLQNVAKSNYNAMQFTLRRTKGPLTLGVSYSYSHSIDDSSDRTEAILPNAYSLAQNRASSDFDQRHLVNISYIYQLPLLTFLKKFNGWADADPTNELAYHGPEHRGLWEGWELSGITLFATGTPFSVVNGGSSSGISGIDNAGVAAGNAPNSYPDIALNPATLTQAQRDGASVNTVGPLLGNVNQFVAPTGLTYGDAGRNFFRNPSRLNFDMAVAKKVKLKRESQSLQFRLEAFNIFNHTQFRIYDPTNPGNSGNNVITCYEGSNNTAGNPACLPGNAFMHPVDAHRPRTMQFGVKFLF